ncbi:hypothetical protein [Parvularcula sp. LCG005]|uniref:hypothetical protein n=1 Tax=Parvularcula sp. LCG005 TaxID=3078805 RepID=UPI0029420B7E|nr:hypothetical protein [Parvularcula sp. LCG005]WOI54417.1 hypothetical protein RUI03_05295 [Parvularcula sp. LCG005]
MTQDISFAGYTYAANKACLICEHLFLHHAEPNIIVHDFDGWLQCLCGEVDHISDQAKVVALSQIIDRLPGISELPVLMPGQLAERTRDGTWIVEKIEDA